MIVSPLPEIEHFSTENCIRSKVCTDESVKKSNTTVCPPIDNPRAATGDNPPAKVLELSPCTYGQNEVYLLLTAEILVF